MDARIAAELLYESEATLRMVDTVIDELQISEGETPEQSQGLWAFRTEERDGAEVHMPPEVCVRGYWQVHELIECVRQARTLIAPDRQQTELAFADGAGQPRIDRVTSLLDTIDSLEDAGDPQRAALTAELRDEVQSLLDSSASVDGNEQRLSAAITLLAEAEARLLRLGRLFEDADR